MGPKVTKQTTNVVTETKTEVSPKIDVHTEVNIPTEPINAAIKSIQETNTRLVETFEEKKEAMELTLLEGLTTMQKATVEMGKATIEATSGIASKVAEVGKKVGASAATHMETIEKIAFVAIGGFVIMTLVRRGI